ncbi:MAG: PRC-barrel domain protein [Clostridiales bacterium]|jgi:uncharacterized protein YrrD|nr:PRC-barrel domain protein [Clostridiales bacterium]
MLIRAGELLNKRIVSYETGNDCGEVKDIAISLKSNKVIGLYYQNSGILKKEVKFLALNNILNFEHQNITVKEKLTSFETANTETEKFTLYRKKKIISKAGKELGILEDIAFIVPNGEIKYLDVSDGIICDIINGRKHIAFGDLIVVGEDFLVVN